MKGFNCSLPDCTGADVNRSTTNNDHTVLSLASAGGHVSVVQYLLIRGAEPSYCLRVSHSGVSNTRVHESSVLRMDSA